MAKFDKIPPGQLAAPSRTPPIIACIRFTLYAFQTLSVHTQDRSRVLETSHHRMQRSSAPQAGQPSAVLPAISEIYISKTDPENSPGNSELLYLNGNRWLSAAPNPEPSQGCHWVELGLLGVGFLSDGKGSGTREGPPVPWPASACATAAAASLLSWSLFRSPSFSHATALRHHTSDWHLA